MFRGKQRMWRATAQEFVKELEPDITASLRTYRTRGDYIDVLAVGLAAADAKEHLREAARLILALERLRVESDPRHGTKRLRRLQEGLGELYHVADLNHHIARLVGGID